VGRGGARVARGRPEARCEAAVDTKSEHRQPCIAPQKQRLIDTDNNKIINIMVLLRQKKKALPGQLLQRLWLGKAA
jgi:hypothetical protein